MKRLGLLLLLAPLLVSFNIALSQDEMPPLAENEVEIVFEEGINDYEGTRDTTIYEEGDQSNGGGQHIFSGETSQGNFRRALIAYDLSEIPAGSEITLVLFQVVISRTPTQRENTDVELHRLTADWGEGEVDAPGQEGRGFRAADGDATWNSNFLNSSKWETPGGDFVPEPSATARATGTGSIVRFEGEGLIADAQHWIDTPEENFGWIFVSDGQARRYHSSDSTITDEGNKPRLVVRYIPPENL